MPYVDFAALREWLLQTVPGIIVLGAVGSVLGSLLWLMLRALTRRLVGSWKHFLFALAYGRFGRHIEIGEKIHAHFAAEAKAQRYVLFAIGEVAGWILETGLAIVATAGTVAIAVVYGIDRPILLVVAISLSVPLILQSARSGCFIACVLGESVDHVKDTITAAQPKRYRDYAKSRLGSSGI